MGVFNQKASTQKEFDLAPAGSHAACLIAIIDLGTHSEQFQGQAARDNRKVFFCWEIDHEPDGGKGRCVIGREYNAIFTSKSALRIMVEKWRGKTFNDDEEFDISKLLGKPCLLTITHTTTGDNTYAKIDGIGPMPKGMAKLEPHRKPIQFDHDSGQPFPSADWLPYSFGEKLIDKYGDSKEKKGKTINPANDNGKSNPRNDPTNVSFANANADDFDTFD